MYYQRKYKFSFLATFFSKHVNLIIALHNIIVLYKQLTSVFPTFERSFFLYPEVKYLIMFHHLGE